MSKTAEKKNGKVKTGTLPKGFTEVRSRLDGFFTLEPGNYVVGILRGSFEVEGKFGRKKVYRIQVTDGQTRIGDDGEIATVGQTVGLDEKGFLQSLGDLDVGTAVYVRYEGIGEKGSKGNAPHIFTVGKAET